MIQPQIRDLDILHFGNRVFFRRLIACIFTATWSIMVNSSFADEADIRKRCIDRAGIGDPAAIEILCDCISRAWKSGVDGGDLNVVDVNFGGTDIPVMAVARVLGDKTLIPPDRFGGIVISNGTTPGPMILDQVTAEIGVTFRHVTFGKATVSREIFGLPEYKDISVSANSANFEGRIVFSNVTFSGKVVVGRSKFDRGLYFIDSTFTDASSGGLIVRTSEIKRTLGFLRDGAGTWQAPVKLYSNTMHNILVINELFDQGLHIAENNLRSIEVKSAGVDKLLTIENNDIAKDAKVLFRFGKEAFVKARPDTPWFQVSDGPSISANNVGGDFLLDIAGLAPQQTNIAVGAIRRELILDSNNVDRRFIVRLPKSLFETQPENAKFTRVNLKDSVVGIELGLYVSDAFGFIDSKKDIASIVTDLSVKSAHDFRDCHRDLRDAAPNILKLERKRREDERKRQNILSVAGPPSDVTMDAFFAQRAVIDLSGAKVHRLLWALPFHCVSAALTSDLELQRLEFVRPSISLKERHHPAESWTEIIAVPTPQNIKWLSDYLHASGELQRARKYLEVSKRLDYGLEIAPDSWKTFNILRHFFEHSGQFVSCIFGMVKSMILTDGLFRKNLDCFLSYSQIVLLYPGGYGADPIRVLFWLLGLWVVGVLFYANELLRQDPNFKYLHWCEWSYTIMDRNGTPHRKFKIAYPTIHFKILPIEQTSNFKPFDKFVPETCSVLRYSLDALLPVVNLHAYDRFFGDNRGVQFFAAFQHIAGWWLVSVFLASISIL